MISPARRIAYKLLYRIELQRLFSDDALNSPDMEKMDVRDRHLTTEIVYGTLRWQGTLDYILGKRSARPWKDVESGAKILLRMSLYQMWRMDRIPDHALVNDAVELAKRELGKGIDRYINGMLRHLTRTRPWKEGVFLQDAPEWIRVSLPQWLYERWTERFGEKKARDFALSLNHPPQTAFRFAQRSQQSDCVPSGAVRSELVPDAYIQTGIENGSADSIAGNTIIQFQDEASQLIPNLLGREIAGGKVWDVCAAPGGKSAILCRMAGESGRVVVSDLRMERVLRLAQHLKDAGVLYPNVIVADARQGAPFQSCFDAVLADVPCSCLGTLRRNPEIKWHFSPKEFAALQRTQKRILQSASESVRPGGFLLYSTCSTEPEENEHVIESFLQAHSDFHLESPRYPQGIEKWLCEDKMVRTFPTAYLWDGFFAALLVRR
jgi:16S rRNA (cytosine967-C5)-methyltransferase